MNRFSIVTGSSMTWKDPPDEVMVSREVLYSGQVLVRSACPRSRGLVHRLDVFFPTSRLILVVRVLLLVLPAEVVSALDERSFLVFSHAPEGRKRPRTF